MNIKIYQTLIVLMFLFLPKIIFSQSPVKMTLDEVVKTAIENNQTIKSAKLNIQKEEAISLKSFNIPKPEIFVEYEGVQGSLSNAESRKIGFQQQFEFPINYFLRSDLQSSQILVAEEELNVSINRIKEKIKLNYNQLLLLSELLRSSENSLKIYETFLLTAQKKYEAGESSNLEVLGAKVGKIKFENGIKNLNSEIRSAQSEMKYLMNVDYEILPAGELSYKDVSLSKNSIIKMAISSNPEIKMIQYEKEKFSNKKSLSKGELLPDISFKYFRQKIGGQNDYWGMEVGLGVPLWFWWDHSGNIKESEYELQIASSEELSLKRSLENQIEVTFEEYENNLRQVKFFREEAIKETDEILRQSKISYDEGEIGYVEYLQSLNLAYDTQTQYLKALYNYNQSIIKLEKLSAGDLK
ncbi:MAG TPA: TolC family protein [Ignavibacteria bacterium]|nr:TolC family protein [Ignavibacteria bacterium]HMR40517.1 TolC family protein [Ignavibacteria bacterium]